MTTGRLHREAIVLGLGHIGASLAAALSFGGWRVWGWDKSAAAVRLCRDEGWIQDALSRDLDVRTHSRVCVVALPETALSDAKVAAALAQLPPGTIVTEVFSSKGEGTSQLARLCARRGLPFGWSHPLAGREGRGATSADSAIFAGARALIDSDAPAVVRAELSRFWRAVGCEVEFLTTDEHQRRMAAGSHLIHVLAYSLMHAMGAEKSVSPSVLGATRVAKSNPEAWAVILSSNRREVLASVERLQRELKRATGLLRRGDEEALEKYLAEAQRARLRMESKR